MLSSKKGITPVIAIVLLLLITVGAVGVVYTQFQNLVGNPGSKVDKQQKVRQTEMAFTSVYKETKGYSTNFINITVRNKGEVAWNPSDFQLQFIPTGSNSPISGDILDNSNDYSFNSSEAQCFSQDTNPSVVNPTEKYTCQTGVEWLGATESITLVVKMKDASKSWSYTCRVATGSSVSC